MVVVQLADRFHKWPWELDDQPARKVLKWINILSSEASARADLYGLADDETMTREGRE